MICLTHLHGDHCLGLPGLLGSMGLDQRKRPLRLVGPKGTKAWFDTMHHVGIVGLPFQLEITELESRTPRGDGPVIDIEPLLDVSIRTTELTHRVPSFAFRFDEPPRRGHFDHELLAAHGLRPGPLLGVLQREGIAEVDGQQVTLAQVTTQPRAGASVVIFGDTTSCDSAPRIARKASHVVHEATFESVHASHALRWLHSTGREVALLAREAELQRLLLTHFSSRYPSPSGVLAEAQAIFPATQIANEGEWINC